jgi:hypothetical protein
MWFLPLTATSIASISIWSVLVSSVVAATIGTIEVWAMPVLLTVIGVIEICGQSGIGFPRS